MKNMYYVRNDFNLLLNLNIFFHFYLLIYHLLNLYIKFIFEMLNSLCTIHGNLYLSNVYNHAMKKVKSMPTL